MIGPPRIRKPLSLYHVRECGEFGRLARPVRGWQPCVPFRDVFGRTLASPFVAGRTTGTLILSGRAFRPLGGSAVLRTRYAIAALLGVVMAAVAVGQVPRNFGLSVKDKDGKFVPYYQEMSTEVGQHIKVQGQDLQQQQKSLFYYQWTPIKEEKVKEGNEDVTKWTLKQKIEGLKMNIDISGNPINYDSTKADAPGSAGNPGLLEFFKN